MRVAVTGGSGKLGRAVIALLERSGHTAYNFDAAAPQIPTRAYTRTVLNDYGQVLDALLGIEMRHNGFDALVHLAALPGTGYVPDVETFHNNMSVSFNVFHAARRAGIKNIVYASSETLLGVPFVADPPYLPADEDFPARPENLYSLVKHLEDAIATQFVRWDPSLKIISLRMAHVMDESEYADFPSFDADVSTRSWNLWSYLDARDGAQAVLRALEHDIVGYDYFVISADDTVMSKSSAELVAARFPNVTVRGSLGEHQSLESSAKAKRVLGFQPEYSWRTTLT